MNSFTIHVTIGWNWGKSKSFESLDLALTYIHRMHAIYGTDFTFWQGACR